MRKEKAIARQRKQQKEIAKKLKSAKLIDFDLRRNLTPAQKGRITKLWKGPKHKETGGRGEGWKTILDNEQIVFRSVSKKREKQLVELGYRSNGKGRVYIDSEGFDEVHIKRNKIIKKKPGKVISDLLIPDRDVLETLERLTDKPMPRGMEVTVRIGDYAPFRQSFVSFESLLRYVSNWKPKKDLEQRDNLVGQMSIVKIFET